MKRQILITVSIILCCMVSCTDYMDVTPKGKVIPTTVDQLGEILKNASAVRRSIGNMYYYSDDIKMYQDEVGRIFSNPVGTINAYLFNDYLYPSTADNDQDWNLLYEVIYLCNYVLDNIEDAEGDDEAKRAHTKAQALAHRAYAYFMLVNQYAKHYDPQTSESDPGVPLLTKPEIDTQNPRASVAAVYELIEKDLLEAESLAPTDVLFNYHASRAGIQGLLAKVFLFKGDWANGLLYASKALEANDFLYDYNNFDFMPGMPPMFGIPGYPTSGYEYKESIWLKTSMNVMAYIIGVYMTEEHLSLYDEGDRRLYFTLIDQFFFGPNLHGPVIYVRGNLYLAGVLVPELFLIRAECNARLDNVPEAINELNTLREHRFTNGTFVPYSTSISSLEALELVIKERRVELFLTGQRLFDLKRLNKDPHFAKTIHRSFGEHEFTIEPDDPNYVLPIPLMVTGFNPLVEQNPRAGRSY